MLIAVDIGNSSINIGYFSNSGLIVQKIDTFPPRNSEEYRLILNDFLSQNHIEKNGLSVIISSVVIGHSAVMTDALKRLSNDVDPEVITVNHRMATGIDFDIDAPEELGTDRIAGCVAACELYGVPAVVVDFGTATTISAVNRHKRYVGGSIMPGLGLMNTVLEDGTSKLKKVALKPPSSAMGRDTSGCIISGIFFGGAGAVERIIDEMEREMNTELTIVITGGFASIMDRFMKRSHEVNPDLTLEGLRILYDKNRSS